MPVHPLSIPHYSPMGKGRRHDLSILPVGNHEYTVYCENPRCDFNETHYSIIMAKDACFKHLRQIIAEETSKT
jgi:hypothetical protein